MSFRLVFEIEPPRVPDLKKVISQIEIMGPVVDSILVPDNHLGRPALSSLAVALEVRNHGFKPIVAINARDRNLLRLQSDLLTLKAYEIDEVLFLYGDSAAAERSSLKVRHMLRDEFGEGLQRGVVATIGRPLGWRAKADFLLTKLAFGRSKAGYWREAEGFIHPLFCGVIALPDRTMAKKILDNIPDLEVPAGYLDAFDSTEEAGFDAAFDELDELKASGVDGAHLVVPARRRAFAERLQDWISSSNRKETSSGG